jgi:MFS family permease
MKKRVEKDSPRIEKLKKQSRRLSIKEGIIASAKGSFGDSYISPFAIAINSSNSLVALFSSISGLLGPLSQVFGSRLIEKTSRKKIILRAVVLESIIWLLLAGLAILFAKNILTAFLPIFLLLTFAIYVIIVNMAHPSFFSWLGDIVDENKRGAWFSRRSLLTGFVSVILAISASFMLDYFKKQDQIMIGFIILFSLAFIMRLLCWNIFRRQYEPKMKFEKGYYFSFWDFVTNAPKNNFGKFSIFRFAFGFACTITSPLIAIYLLRILGFSYTTYMIVIFSGSIYALVFIKIWGKIADKYGNYVVLILTTILIPTTPILWILNPSPIYLILVPSLVGGIAWAGFHLAVGNFIYDNVSKQKRGLVVSYYNLMLGIGIFLGSIISALLIKILPEFTTHYIAIIFIFGALVRMAVVAVWIPKIREIRKTKKFRGVKTFKDLVLKEAKPTLIEEYHEIIAIKDYLRE